MEKETVLLIRIGAISVIIAHICCSIYFQNIPLLSLFVGYLIYWQYTEHKYYSDKK